MSLALSNQNFDTSTTISRASTILSSAMSAPGVGENTPFTDAVVALNVGLRAIIQTPSLFNLEILETLTQTVEDFLRPVEETNVISFDQDDDILSGWADFIGFYTSQPIRQQQQILSSGEVDAILASAIEAVRVHTTNERAEDFDGLPSTGLWLRNLRELEGLTQVTAAEYLAEQGNFEFMSRHTVSDWERNERVMTPEDIAIIAESFGIPKPKTRTVRNILIGARFRALREHTGLSPKEFAAQLGVNHETYAHYERGRLVNPDWLPEVEILYGARMANALSA